MKKYVLFSGSFVLAYIALQIGSGLLLTVFYKPGNPWGEAASSQVEFGYTSLNPLLISLVSLGIAFTMTKLFGKKSG